jgi:tetratricopeptide (TPR) repeat protein
LTVDVPFRLTRREVPAAADAGLLCAGGFGPLAAACARLGGDALPAVFAVRGGFLTVPRGGVLPHGVVRLRRVAGDLFVPADADLVPALLPDELVGLTRDRGLIVLPGGTVLAFDPRCPLAVGDWLKPAAVRRAEWRPFPPRPDRAERLTVIERPAPPAAVVELLTAGEPDDADPLPGAGEGTGTEARDVPEDARPPSAPLGRRVVAGIRYGFGQFLGWLGRHLRVPGFARRGADLARRAVEQVPRLTERLLGAQEAALREVLRQLRSGDVEKALRRAPVAVPDPDAPARVGTNADLGTRDPRYDLRTLVGGGPTPGGVWLGGGGVWALLAEEYRRLAREAQARGDYRRAAYLYGVLLRDPRSAANALVAGGLFRDAGILFRDRVHDLPAAALAFERAGDYDEAVRLYDRLNRWEAAGELLKRLGDDDRAVEYFTRAADELAVKGYWLAAGDLIRTKAGRDELATGYYRHGWEADRADAVVCGGRLLDRHLVAEEWDAAGELFDAAELRFAPPRAADAGRFFNHARKVAGDFLPPEKWDDLLDRVRLLFARHAKAADHPPSAAEDLFATPGNWPGPVVRDALFAARRPRPRPPAPDHAPPIRLADGAVTAVAVARDSSAVVVATTIVVVCWRPDVGRVVPVCATLGQPVLSIATDPTANIVYLIRQEGELIVLRCYRSGEPGPFEPAGVLTLGTVEEDPGWHLLPFVDDGPAGPTVTVAGPAGRRRFRGLFLRPDIENDLAPGRNTTYLLVNGPVDSMWEWADRLVWMWPVSPWAGKEVRWSVPWVPGRPPGNPLAACPVDWLTPGRAVLEVTGLDREGALYWTRFDGRDADTPLTRTRTRTHPDGFVAACLVAPGGVAAVTARNEVYSFRETGDGLEPSAAPVVLHVPSRVVALASRAGAAELLVVFEDGSAVRVARPWR